MIGGSLFSGIEGFAEGLRRADIETVWSVEIDRHCRSVSAKHFPGVEQFEDVCTVGNHNLRSVDLICGGFPCQDLSVAGKRAGLAGERSGLWHEFRRILAELTPQWVLIENVPGLLSSNGGADMAVVLTGLAELGYGWAYRVLDAQYFGVAQRRRRVFIVGCLGDTRRPAEVLFEPQSCDGNSASRKATGPNLAGTLGGGSDGIGRRSEDDPNLVMATLNSGGTDGGFRTEPGEHLVAHTLSSEGADAGEDGTGRGTPLVVAHTLMNHGVSQNQIRRLTPTECERLQGFPDGWTDGQADSIRYRQLGNAVCVPVVEWIGKRILEAAA